MTYCKRCGKTNPADVHTCTPPEKRPEPVNSFRFNYILDGTTPVHEPDIDKWGNWFESASRVVQRDTVGDALISTVFLGLDHAWGEGTPVLFETMIFGGERDQETRRYHTWDEAKIGHQNILDELTP